MNNVNLIGNLCKDIDTITTASGVTALKNTLAVRRDKEVTDFINIVAFGKTAELIAQYHSKGDQIGINGRIQSGKYTNKQGVTVYTTDVIVNSISFVKGKSDSKPQESKTEVFNDEAVIDVGSDDLPF